MASSRSKVPPPPVPPLARQGVVEKHAEHSQIPPRVVPRQAEKMAPSAKIDPDNARTTKSVQRTMEVDPAWLEEAVRRRSMLPEAGSPKPGLPVKMPPLPRIAGKLVQRTMEVHAEWLVDEVKPPPLPRSDKSRARPTSRSSPPVNSRMPPAPQPAIRTSANRAPLARVDPREEVEADPFPSLPVKRDPRRDP